MRRSWVLALALALIGCGDGSNAGDGTGTTATGSTATADADTGTSDGDDSGDDGATGTGTGADGGTGSATDTGSGTDTDPPASACADPGRDASDFDHVLHVGPEQPHASPSDVPWETLQPGTLVLIHWRPEPYRDKWVIATSGTARAPVVVRGVAEGGELPVITGENAATRPELDFWSEDRAVIKIGGSSSPGETPAHVTIENLEIRSGHLDYTFTDDSGSAATYAKNAASIFVESGNEITIRGCEIHDSGNGLFVAHQASNVTVIANSIHGNGVSSSILEHNSYTEADGILFQCNRYGLLRDGAGGNNLKDRSAGTVIRYNWIRGGNRQLDLVDSSHLNDAGGYDETFVYGNVFIELDGQGNRQIVHYGGDGDQADYRKGMLYLIHNTLFSTRDGRTSLVRLSTDEESATIHGNLVHVTAGGNELEIAADGTGSIELTENWLTQGWTHSFVANPSGSLSQSGNEVGQAPGFVDLAGEDFRLDAGSPAIDQASPPPSDADSHPIARQYVEHRFDEPRPDDGMPDMGAFESDRAGYRSPQAVAGLRSR